MDLTHACRSFLGIQASVADALRRLPPSLLTALRAGPGVPRPAALAAGLRARAPLATPDGPGRLPCPGPSVPCLAHASMARACACYSPGSAPGVKPRAAPWAGAGPPGRAGAAAGAAAVHPAAREVRQCSATQCPGTHQRRSSRPMPPGGCGTSTSKPLPLLVHWLPLPHLYRPAVRPRRCHPSWRHCCSQRHSWSRRRALRPRRRRTRRRAGLCGLGRAAAAVVVCRSGVGIHGEAEAAEAGPRVSSYLTPTRQVDFHQTCAESHA
jgi:hypothetical protein